MAQGNKKRKKGVIHDVNDDIAPKINGTPRKKQRMFTQDDAVFAKIYEDLAHEVGSVRLDAAKLLMTKLSYDLSLQPKILVKALKRLIRGLCSSRKAARSGFFIAFTEYLRSKVLRLPEDLAGTELGLFVQQCVDEETFCGGKASAQEKRDYSIGRVLAYQAMIESQFVFEAQDSGVLWKAMLQRMFSQAKSTPRLRDEYCSVINNCIPALAKQDQRTSFINDILSATVDHQLENTPEGVALWLTILANSSKVSYPEGCWRNQDPLDKHERPRLIRIVKGSTDYETSNTGGTQKPQPSGNQTRLSFAWNVLIFSYLDRLDPVSTRKNSKSKNKFGAFWKEMVDDIFFAENASPERKSLGLQLLTSSISSCPSWVIPSLFSPNAMRCIVNHRSHPERLLHEAAKAPLDKAKTRVRTQPELAGLMFKTLVSSTAINFDQLTKTKTITDMLTETDSKYLPEVLELIDAMVLNPTSLSAPEVTEADANRRMLADLLLTITRSRNVDLAADWAAGLFDILLRHSYFDVGSSDHVAISRASREVFRSRLMSCVNHMMSSPSQAPEICFTVILSLKEMRKRKDLSSLLQMDDEIERSLVNAFHTVAEMYCRGDSDGCDATRSPTSNAFACLYALTILQVHNEEPDAVAMLEEIDTAYKATIDGEDSVNEAFDLLTEVLLSMVSKQSAMSRKVAEQAFTVIAPQLTSSTLQSMVAILDQKENTTGQYALFDQNEDDGVDDTIEGVEESDVEEISPIDEDDASDGTAEDVASGGGTSDDDEDAEEEMQKLNRSLGNILKTGRSGAAEETTDDESMDDEQMMALEPHLAKIFQEQKKASSKKKDNKDAKEMMISFKNRVLDLLAIYIKQQHSNALALDLILPLLRLVSDSTSKQVSEKAFNLLKQYIEICGKKREGLPKFEDPESIWTILERVLEQVGRNNSKFYQNACSRASLFLVKVLSSAEQGSGKKEAHQALTRAHDMFSGLQKQWIMNSKLEIQLSFFQNWLGWCNDIRKAK